jgi:hypothetical protein
MTVRDAVRELHRLSDRPNGRRRIVFGLRPDSVASDGSGVAVHGEILALRRGARVPDVVHVEFRLSRSEGGLTVTEVKGLLEAVCGSAPFD